MHEASRNIHFIRKSEQQRISVVIPAAGLSTRLRMKSSKCLAELKQDYTLLDKNIDNIRCVYKDADIVVVAGYEIERYRDICKRKNVRLVYNQLFESTNVAYSVGLGLDAINTNNCLIILGDLYYNKESINNIDINNTSKILVNKSNTINEYEVGFILNEENRVSRLSYGVPNKWAQIAYFYGPELDKLRDVCYDYSSKKFFLYEAINKVIVNGGKIEIFQVNGSEVFDIDTLEELYKVINYDSKHK